MKKILFITTIIGLFIFSQAAFSQGCMDASDEDGVQLFGFI